MKFFIIALMILCTIGISISYAVEFDHTLATVQWERAGYSHVEGTKATVIVTESDMNKYPNAIDYIWVTIHSDSDNDLLGTRMTLFETGFDSGVFQKEITFVNSPPTGNGFLYVRSGDTIGVKYVDSSLPANFTLPESSRFRMVDDGVEVRDSSLVGLRGPPLERVPAKDFTLVSRDLEPIKDNLILIDQQVQLKSDFENQQNRTQPFAYLVQIRNEQGTTEFLSWITGNLTSFQKTSSGVVWTPSYSGAYTANAFIWESVDNPTALSPPLEMEITVKDEWYTP